MSWSPKQYLAEKILSRPHPRLFKPDGNLCGFTNRLASDIYLRSLRSFQFLPADKLRTAHEKRITSLLEIARKTDFYRTHLAGINNIGDFYNLTPIGKEQMRKETENGSVINSRLLNYKFPHWTSGSTGIPFRFFIDKNMAARRIALYRLTLQWIGKRDEDRVILLMPFSHPFLENEYLHFPCQDPEYLELKFEEIAKLLEHGPIVLQSRTSYLIRLAQLFEKHKKQFSFRAVISYTEELTEDVRHYLEQVFQAPVFNYYGCNEVSFIGHECEARDGLHVNTGWTYCEIVDNVGKPLSSGQVGNVVVTSLDNEIMPFIRYETGDRGYWLSKPCLCGRTFPRIKIEGRKGGIFFLPDGTTRYAWQLLWPIASRANKIKKYQAVRHSPSELEIRIIPTEHFSSADKEEITQKLQTYLGHEIKLALHLVDYIPSASGGKQQPFINLYKDSVC